MSWFCVFDNSYPGDMENPPENYCEIGYDDCENCPQRWSEEDFEGDLADMERDDMF